MVCIASLELREEPHNAEVEQQILGSIFLDEKKMNELSETVKTDMFFHQQHKDIYNAMLYLFFNNSVIDYKTVINRLTFKKVEHDIDYILNISNNVLNMKNFDNQVKILVELYEKRLAYKFGKTLVSEDISGIASSSIKKQIESLMDNMSNTSNIITEEFGEFIDEWDKKFRYDLEHPDEIKVIKTGFRELDSYINIRPSNLILIAARPGGSKSAFALNLSKNFCKQGYYTFFVSLEMSKTEIMDRLVANMANVKVGNIINKKNITKDDLGRISKVKSEIKKFKLNSYTKSITIDQLVGIAKKLKKENKLDVLVVDYLQLVKVKDGKMNEYQKVSAISKRLKELAMDLEIPIIALSQLSRNNIDNGKPREPQLADLRGSGSLEEDSNKVLMLHSKAGEKVLEEKFIKLYIRKNREGKMGAIDYSFFGDYMHFTEKVWSDKAKDYVAVEQEELSDKPKIKETQQIEDLPF